MATLQELLAQQEELERLIARSRAATKAAVLDEIRTLMSENGLTVADVTASTGRPKTASKERRQVAAKYRDSNGNSWTGRGLKPRWLQMALAAGASLEDFAV